MADNSTVAQSEGVAPVVLFLPAHDEEAAVAGVVGRAPAEIAGHPVHVLVVDDGSTDDTAARARASGVTVISLPRNRGKAHAMSRGVHAARNDIVFFCDADVTGLTPERITRILTPVTSEGYGMFVGIRGRKTYWANRLLHFTPILGGERALRKSLWDHVPRTYKKNFQIEIALNFYAKNLGHRMGFTVVHGLSQVIKEKKRGLLPGLWQRLSMIGDILLVSWRIYAVLQAQVFYERLLREATTPEPVESLERLSSDSRRPPR